jgi:hypothetical protein
MATLGSLVVSLAVDTARFQGDLGRAAAIAEQRMRNIKDTASRALGAVSVLASATGAALVASLRAATNRADDFRDLAAGAGVTVEAFSRLQFAASQSGVETEQLAKALAKLAKEGSKDAARDLAAIADQFAAMPDGAAKTAKAIELFGERVGPGLVPLLNEGSEGLRRMAEQSDALGNTITTSTAAAADEFNDKLGLLRAGAGGFGQLLAAELLPTLNGLIESLLSSATASDTLKRAAEVAATGLRLLITVGDGIVTSFLLVGRTVGALAAALVAFASGDFSGAVDIIRQRFSDVGTELEAFQARFAATWEAAGAATAARAPQVAGQLSLPGKLATDELKRIAAERKAALEDMRASQQSIPGAEILNGGEETFAPLIQKVASAKVEVDSFRAVNLSAAAEMSAAWETAADGFSNAIANALVTGKLNFRGFLQDILREIAASQVKKALAGLFSTAAGGAGGGFFGFLGGLFGGGKADGGPVRSGTTYLVGERGPELFRPRTSGEIVPNGAGSGVVIAPNYTFHGTGISYEQANLLMRRNNEELVRLLTDSRRTRA